MPRRWVKSMRISVSTMPLAATHVPLEKAVGHDEKRAGSLALAAHAGRRTRSEGRKVTPRPDRGQHSNSFAPKKGWPRYFFTMLLHYVIKDRHSTQISLMANLDPRSQSAPQRCRSRFAGKTVFFGLTAQTAMRDRWMTPLSNGVAMSGIEINANVYETIAHGLFLPLTHRSCRLHSFV